MIQNVLKGEIYGGFGAKASIKLKDYSDGLVPDKCLNMNAYLYAEIGVKVTINLFIIDTIKKLDILIIVLLLLVLMVQCLILK